MTEKHIIHATPYAKLVKSEQDYLVYETPELVCVLPVLPNGNVLLIEQYRIPVKTRLLELVTGGIHAGEEPALAAIREVSEEAGYTTKELVHIGDFFSAPGYITQKAHVYLAYTDEFIGSTLEEHEKAFGLHAQQLSLDEAIAYTKTHVTHPYLTIALQHVKKH